MERSLRRNRRTMMTKSDVESLADWWTEDLNWRDFSLQSQISIKNCLICRLRNAVRGERRRSICIGHIRSTGKDFLQLLNETTRSEMKTKKIVWRRTEKDQWRYWSRWSGRTLEDQREKNGEETKKEETSNESHSRNFERRTQEFHWNRESSSQIIEAIFVDLRRGEFNRLTEEELKRGIKCHSARSLEVGKEILLDTVDPFAEKRSFQFHQSFVISIHVDGQFNRTVGIIRLHSSSSSSCLCSLSLQMFEMNRSLFAWRHRCTAHLIKKFTRESSCVNRRMWCSTTTGGQRKIVGKDSDEINTNDKRRYSYIDTSRNNERESFDEKHRETSDTWRRSTSSTESVGDARNSLNNCRE